MSNLFTYVNDSFVPAGEASLKVGDLAIQRGYGVFDFFQTVRGKPVFLEDHLDRFYRSAEVMRLPVGRDRGELKGILGELIRVNGLPESGVRIVLTGGYSRDAYEIATPNLVITQSPLGKNGEVARRGMKLITHTHVRQFSEAKTLDYLMAVWLQPVVKGRGADDVLYEQGGVVSECPRSNFFVVTGDGRVVTPGERVLKGVVRKQVLKIAGRRFAVEEGVVTLEEIKGAREAFVTSTTKGVLPVVEVDGKEVGEGKPGEITGWLGREFEAYLEGSL